MINGITAKELSEKIINQEEVFILDVRNTGDFDDWKIEGKKVTIINKPYFNLMDGVEEILEELPKGQEIIVVCAKEGSSVFVAEQLVEAGLNNIKYLTGGMKAWSEHLVPVKIGDLNNGGSIYQFNRMGKGCLSYLVESNGEAMLIDTARMIEPYLEFMKEKNLTLKYVADTHLHADHISGGRKLAEQTGASYYLPPKDAEEVVFDYNPLEEGHTFTVGTTKVKVDPIYSPGHTIGSTSFVVEDTFLLTGDILFVESIGRPDLAGKAEDWVGDLRNTLYNTYKKLPQDLYILPAHFSKVSELDSEGKVMASLEEMYTKNEGLQVDNETVFRTMVTENLPPQPNAYQEIRQTNMGRIEPNEEEQREMEIGPNRCAVHK